MFSSNRLRKSALAVLIVLVSVSPLFGAKARPARTDVLDLLGGDTLFCVRINNLDKALGLVDEYLSGLSPMPLSMMAKMPLAQVLGDSTLKNVKTKGTFVAFGKIYWGEKGKSNDIFVAGLVPVTDYDKFVSDNPNCGEPDKKGISKITPAGGHGPKMLVKKVGDYALIGPANGYDEILAISKGPGENTLKANLDRMEMRAARQAPFWANGNIQMAAKAFGPLIFAQVDKAKKAMENLPQQQPDFASPAEVIDMYVEVLKYGLNEIDRISLAVTPSAEACTISVDTTAVEGKDLAGILVPSKAKRNTLMPYLKDDAMVNVAMKINKPLAKDLYDRLYYLIGVMAGDAISADDMKALKQLTEDELDSFGDAMAFSLSSAVGSKPPFAMTYAAEITNQEKYAKVLMDSIKLMDTGAIGDLYKSMGLKLAFEIKPAADKYKDVSIDFAKLNFKPTDPDSDIAKAIDALYGKGFDYRWAIVDGLGVYSICGDVDADIRKMIDTAKSGDKKKVPASIKEAIAMLPSGQRADYVGTFNYVRAIAMGLGMAKSFVPDAAHLPNVDVKTESNIAFSGKIRKGAIHEDIVLPKKHLLEIVSTIKQIDDKAKAGQKKKQPQELKKVTKAS